MMLYVSGLLNRHFDDRMFSNHGMHSKYAVIFALRDQVGSNR
jgi:hypothetical protein